MFDTAQAQELFLQGEDAFSQIWVTAAPGTSQEQLRDAVAAVLPSDTQAATGDATAARAASRIDEALSFVTTFLLVFAGIALTVGRVPHRQHLLDPRRPAQPGARPAARDRRQPPAGGALGAARGGRGRDSSGRPSASASGVAARHRHQGGLRSVRPRPQQERAGARAPHRRRQPRRRACSSPSPRPTSRRAGRAASHRWRRCATTWPSPRAACGGGSRWARCCSPPASPRMTAGLLGVGVRAHLRARRRRLRRARRHRPAQPRARPAGARRAGLGLPAGLRGGGPHGRAEHPAQPPAHRRHRLGPDDRRLARDDDGGARGVGQGQPRQDPGRGHRRRLRRLQPRGAAVLGARSPTTIEQVPGRGRGRTGARRAAPGRRRPRLRHRPSTRRPSRPSPGPRSSPARSTTSTPRRWRSRPSSRRTQGLAVGSTRHHRLRRRGAARWTVVATYVADSVLQSDVTMSLDGFDAIGVPPTDRTVYVVAQPGTDRAALAAGLDAVVADLPTVSVNDQAAFAAEQRQPIDRLLFIVYALLGLAVVIAVLGIVNTLALSVIERIREIGLLRAVGLSRRQLRTMLRLESVAIALLGAVLGVVRRAWPSRWPCSARWPTTASTCSRCPGGQLVGFVVVAAWSGCSRRSGPAAGPPGSTCCAPSPPTDRRPAVASRRRVQENIRVAWASASAYCDPAAPSTCPIESSEARTCCWVPRHWATTPWNCVDAEPVQASWRPVSAPSSPPPGPRSRRRCARRRRPPRRCGRCRPGTVRSCRRPPSHGGGARVVRPAPARLGRAPGRDPASCPQGLGRPRARTPGGRSQQPGAAARAPTIWGWPSSSTRLAPRRTAVGGRTWSATPASRSCTRFARAVGIPEPWLRGRPLRRPRGALRGRRRRGRRARRRPATSCGPCRRAGCACRSDAVTRAWRGCAASGSSTARRPTSTSSAPTARPTSARVFAAMAFVRDDAGDLAVVHSVRRGEWGAPGGWREPGETVRRERRSRGPRGDRARRRPGAASARAATSASTAARPAGSGGRGATCSRSSRCACRAGARPCAPSSTTPPTAAGRPGPSSRDLCSRPVLVAAGRRGAQPARRVSSRARFSRADGSHSARACAVR